MSKRKMSEDFACPGCQEQFDTVTHVPFVGSCGHSLCDVCFNRKTTDTCPVCSKEGSFASKGRNELAIELLTEQAENEAKNSKKPRLFNEDDVYTSGEPIPAIVDPKNRPFLAQIVNQLDTWSFVNFAMTCKPLYNYCFNTKEVKHVYDIYCLSAKTVDGAFGFKLDHDNNDDDYLPAYYARYDHGSLCSCLKRKKLRNSPFVFQLDLLILNPQGDSDFLTSVRSLLEEFPVRNVTDIESYEITDWKEFIQFVKDLKTKSVNVLVGNYYSPAIPVENDDWTRLFPEEAATYFLQNMTSFKTGLYVPDRLILDAPTTTELYLPGAGISKDTFMELLMRFAGSTDNVKWKIGCLPFVFGHYDFFKVLPFNYNGPLPEERPIVFAKDDVAEIFWLLRKDESYLRCWNYGMIQFETTPGRVVPYDLRARFE